MMVENYMKTLSILFYIGIHNDPRIGNNQVIYGLGSYVPHSMPASLDYLYFSISNYGPKKAVLEKFFLQTDNGNIVWDLDLPDKHVRGAVIQSGEKLVIGFLRDLIVRKLRYMDELDDTESEFTFRAVCTFSDKSRYISDEYSISKDYPSNPLHDVELALYASFFDRRIELYRREMERITYTHGSLEHYANIHHFLGMHKEGDEWVLREWMPAASELWLTTDALKFRRESGYDFVHTDYDGLWELRLPLKALPHGRYIELHLRSAATGGVHVKRVPAFAVWVEQNPDIQEEWCARVWDPDEKYKFKHKNVSIKGFPRIYEAHIGIAQPRQGRTEKSVGTYAMFTENILPVIKKAGYTAVQLMGIPEHPLYKSFGYQVTNYFAPSSRFGTPDDFKKLVDAAHGMGLGVILDITHSHSAPNTEQGIAEYDTSHYFFSDKDNQWGTRSFDYSSEIARRFLVSNCRYWLEEYRVDGFRFDAVGNMIYTDHGFGDDFSSVSKCFYKADGSPRIDETGVLYLSIVNALIHEISPNAVTIAEEFSGMPGMTSPQEDGGLGFDFRFAMGIPDFWGKFIKEGRTIGSMWYEMNNRRLYEQTISYVASHDQSINGHDAMIWRLIGDDMYENMSVFKDNWKTARGLALYKLMRLLTLSTSSHGYMSFMGDEFGHPEWIDAESYGHRQWDLAECEHTKYALLAAFDRDSMELADNNIDEFRLDPRLRYLNEDERILAFERGGLLFVFNFHELNAAEKLELWVKPGKYTEIMSSDSLKYAGKGNLETGEPAVEHFSRPGEGLLQKITVYVPPMVALVMNRG